MKRGMATTITAVACLALGLLAGLLLFSPGIKNRLPLPWSQEKAWQQSLQSMERENGELVTVRYRVHALYCIDKDSNMIQLGPVGIWPVRSFACWRVSSDVLAGYNWKDLRLVREGGEMRLLAPEPSVLGIDFKKAELIYSERWSGLTMDEKDFLAKTRPALIDHAEKLGIREDARQRLAIVAGHLSSKINRTVKVGSSVNF